MTADDVKHMVARSVEGLTPDNVYVTFTRASVTPPTPPPVNTPAVAANTKPESKEPAEAAPAPTKTS